MSFKMNLKKITIATTAVLSIPLLADVKPAQLFMDNMVIQRETQAPIWGWADDGEEVTVTGSWGGEASTITDSDGKWIVKLDTPKAGGPYTLTFKGKNKVQLNNVLSGDVWLCSGQSNMEWIVDDSANPDQEAATAQYPNIRHFAVARNEANTLADDCSGEWLVCSPETVKNFSATAYFTGRELHKDLNIPIGLINSSYGGTTVQAWTKFSELGDDQFAQNRKRIWDKLSKKYSAETAQKNYTKKMAEWEIEAREARANKKRVPRRPSLQQDPLKDKNYPSNLYNGMINPLLPYAIKGAMWYQGESNAQLLKYSKYYRVQLDRMIQSWRKVWGQDIPFYVVQLPNFRDEQVQPVQSADTWPVLRESIMLVALNTPDTEMVVTIDIGDAKNIHPKNKQDVGRRMASTILNKTYGKQTPTSPILKSCSIENGKVVILFDYTGTGLKKKGDKLKGFAIAGADKKFVWADAVIESRKVVVSSPDVKEPVSVRYAWANNPAECNLYTNEGFPASPFRTDDWPLPAK